jgi:hypothetical protein
MTSDGGYDTDDELPGPSNFLNTYDPQPRPSSAPCAPRATASPTMTDGGNGMFLRNTSPTRLSSL